MFDFHTVEAENEAFDAFLNQVIYFKTLGFSEEAAVDIIFMVEDSVDLIEN